MSLTTPSYFDYNSTPFMQGLSSNYYSFDNQSSNNDSIYGLNSYKKGNANNSLWGGSPRDPMNYKPQNPVPQNFKISDAHEAIDNALPALMPGDSGVGDATAQQTVEQAKANITTIANSPNPDAMAQSIMNQPGYGSDSFGAGLMNIGLAVMSGGSPQEIAKAGIEGSEYFEGRQRKTQMSEYLRDNVKELLDQGYSPDSISAAISNGDNSLLKMQQLSPEQKRKQDLQDDQRAFEQRKELQKAGFEQQYKMADINAQHAEERQQATLEANQAKALAAENQRKAQLNSKYWVDPETNNALVTNSEYNRYNQNFSKQHSSLGVKSSAFHQADTNLQDARDAKASGDDIASRAAYQQSLEQYVKGVMGSGQRSLDDRQLESLGVDPSWIANKTGKFSLAAGFSPTDDNMKYIQKAIDTDSKASKNEANSLMKNEIDRLVKTRGLSIPEATRLANSYASTTLGSDTYDPYGVFGEPTESREEKPKISADQGVVGSNQLSKNKTTVSAADKEAQRLAGYQ